MGQPYSATVTVSNVTVTSWVGTATDNSTGTGFITTPIMPPPGINVQISGQMVTLSGTPTQAGTFTVSITAISGSPSAMCAQTTNYEITISPGSAPTTMTITTASPLQVGTVGQSYSAPLMQTGGVGAVTWTALGSLPPGLMVNATNGTIFGTPTQGGTYTFTIQAADSQGHTAQKQFMLSVFSGFHITTTGLVTGTVGQTYTYTLAALGGTMPYGWAATGLPGGLTVNAMTGVISGTPTASGTFMVTVSAHDSGSLTDSQTFTLVINGSTTGSLSLGPATLPGAQVGSSYSQTLMATGGSGVYNYSLVSGTLPAGVILLTGTGVLSGSPTTAGTYTFTIQAKDTLGATATMTYTVTITNAGAGPPTIMTTTLTPGTVGAAYTQSVVVTGGTPPYTFSQTGLAAGLSIGAINNGGSGIITGTPTSAVSNQSVTITVTDAGGQTATRTFTLNISGAGPTSPLSITPSTVPDATQGAPYNFNIQASGGTSPYFFVMTPNSFDGLSSFSSSGLLGTTLTIQGTPLGAGTFPFGVVLSDSAKGTVSQQYTLTVLPTTTTPPPTTTQPFTFGNTPLMPSFNDPVSATGELFGFDDQPDLATGGPLGLGFVRYYAANLAASGVASALGTNWMHDFDVRLAVSGTTARVTLFRGKTVTFTQAGGGWQLSSTELRPYQLAAAGSGFQFLDAAANLIYGFDSTGALNSIADRNGNTLTVTQAAGGVGPAQVSDSLGRTLTFTYTGKNLTRVQDQSGRGVTFENSNGLLTAFTNANGKRATYAYAPGGGLITAETLPAGNAPLAQQYDGQGRVTAISDGFSTTLSNVTYSANGATVTHPGGMVFTQTLDASHNLSTLSDPSGASSHYTYDANGHLTGVTDRTGATSSAKWDPASGLATSYTDATGNTTTFIYTATTQGPFTFHDLTGIKFADGTAAAIVRDLKGNPTAVTDQAGKVWKATYNTRGQIATATNPSGAVTTYTYGPDGNLISVQLDSGDTTRFAYDGVSRPTTVTEADGAAIAFQYDNLGALTRATDERGGMSAATYDDNENPRSFTDALSAVTSFAYDADNRLTSTTDALGAVTRTVYDSLSRVQTVTNGAGNSVTYAYDSLNRPVSAVDASGKGFKYGWDQESRLISATDALGRVTSYTRNAHGLPVSVNTPNGETYSAVYGAFGMSTTDPLGRTAQIAYDPRGDAASITLPQGVTSSFTRNELGLITTITDPNGNAWQQGYDKMGRMVASADPLGQTTTTAYDARQRPAAITFPQGSAQFTYDPAGNLTGASFSDGTALHFAYDANNRVVSGDGLTIAYDGDGRINLSNGLAITRDAAGRIASIAYAPGKLVQYSYDIRGQLTKVVDWAGGGATFAYDDAGELIATTYSNGVQESRTYDLDGRVATVNLSAGGTGISSIGLTRDGAGEVTSETRATPTLPAPAAGSQSFTYDAADQNTAATYDSLGRVTLDAIRSYNWDLDSRLVSYSGADGAASFTYDAWGQMISRTSGGVTASYALNYATALSTVAVERGASGDARYYVWTPGGALLYSIEAGDNTRHFFHADESASIYCLTDDTGAVTDTYAITPYGELVAHAGPSENPYTFQGGLGVRAEGTTGLYFMRARFYDSVTARLVSRDAIRSLDPREINPYQFARGNPIEGADPTGLQPLVGVRRNIPSYYDHGLHNEAEELTITNDDTPSGTANVGAPLFNIGGYSYLVLYPDLGRPSDTVPVPITAGGLFTVPCNRPLVTTPLTGFIQPNVYQGVVNRNQVTFFGIPIDPPGTQGSRIFRITNVRKRVFGLNGFAPYAGPSVNTGPVPETATPASTAPVPRFVSPPLPAPVPPPLPTPAPAASPAPENQFERTRRNIARDLADNPGVFRQWLAGAGILGTYEAQFLNWIGIPISFE